MFERSEIVDILETSCRRLDVLAVSLDLMGKEKYIEEIESRMELANFWQDQDNALYLVEELKSLRSIVDPLIELRKNIYDYKELFELAEADNDIITVQELADEILLVPDKINSLELTSLLSKPHDRGPCFFSIHTGAGGADACEWAEMLLRMYLRYFSYRGWQVEELNFLAGEEAGIRSIELRVSGLFAYGYLKNEMGVHRLVRISPFSGKRETSFAAVDVVPDYQEDIHIIIEDKDLKIDTYRAGGKGGQHVNKTDSAVRITHLPSGIVVAVQNERSQYKNKDLAIKILKSRLKQREEAERMAKSNAHNATKMDNAWGSQIRNYVMNPYQLVKDIRTGVETGDISKVLDGNLDEFIDAGLRWSVK